MTSVEVIPGSVGWLRGWLHRGRIVRRHYFGGCECPRVSTLVEGLQGSCPREWKSLWSSRVYAAAAAARLHLSAPPSAILKGWRWPRDGTDGEAAFASRAVSHAGGAGGRPPASRLPG
jgi:hypothetical protein